MPLRQVDGLVCLPVTQELLGDFRSLCPVSAIV